jgi:hypothetical protein
MSKITTLYPKDAAKNPDFVLEQAIGKYADLVIIGYNHDDELEVRSNTTFSEAEVMNAIKTFEHNYYGGMYDLEDYD